MDDKQLNEHYVEALSDLLQELVCNEEDGEKARHALAEAINSWYDYHQKELNKWTSLKKLLEQTL